MSCGPTRDGTPFFGCCPPPPSNWRGISIFRQVNGYRPYKVDGAAPEGRCDLFHRFIGERRRWSRELGELLETMDARRGPMYRPENGGEFEGDERMVRTVSDEGLRDLYDDPIRDFFGDAHYKLVFYRTGYAVTLTITDGAGLHAILEETGTLRDPLDPQGIDWVDEKIAECNAVNINTVPYNAETILLEGGGRAIGLFGQGQGGAYTDYNIQLDEFNDAENTTFATFTRLVAGSFRRSLWDKTTRALQASASEQVSYLRERQIALSDVRPAGQGWVTVGCQTNPPQTDVYAPAWREAGFNLFQHTFTRFASNVPDPCSIP